MALNREILGRGWKFPFRIGGNSLSHDGPEQSKFEQHVIECIQHLITTNVRSRRYNRAFGSRLFELPFEELVKAPGLAIRFLKDAIGQEPRVEMSSVQTRVDEVKSALFIEMTIRFLNTTTSANLVFPFYRGETGRPALAEVRVTIN